MRFGGSVSIEREDGRAQTWRIVGEDEADPAAGSVSHVSPLARAVMGKRVGDEVTVAGQSAEIVAVGGRKDPIFNDLRHGVTVGSVKDGIEFTVRRPADGSTRTVLLKPDTDLGAPTVGVTSPFSLTLPADLSRGLAGAAAEAKPPLMGGDTIRTVDGKTVTTYAELLAELSTRPADDVTLTVDRVEEAAPGGKGRTSSLTVTLPPQPRLVTGMTLSPMPIKAVQEGSPAALSGIKAGARLIAVEGQPVGDPFTLDDRLRALVGKAVALTLADEQGTERTVDVRPRAVTWRDDETTGIGSPVSIASLGLAIPVDALVAAVAADSPAARAGIVVGDRVAKAVLVTPGEKPDPAAGIEFSPQRPNWPVVAAVLQQLPAGTSLLLFLEAADGVRREVTLEPVAVADQFVVDRDLVFEPVYETVRAHSVADALGRGVRKAKEDLSMVYGFLGKLTKREISPRLLGGPIEIAKQAGRSASEGFGRLLLFLTMLSANLAVVNFLPIPVLDGGHMVFLAYELIRGKPPSDGVVAVLSYLGLALILSLMFFVFGLDLGLIPRR